MFLFIVVYIDIDLHNMISHCIMGHSWATHMDLARSLRTTQYWTTQENIADEGLFRLLSLWQ